MTKPTLTTPTYKQHMTGGDEDSRVFVYGTLRQQGHLHDMLRNNGAKLIARGDMNGRLYDTGMGFPAMTTGNIEHPIFDHDRVSGEVYLVTDQLLNRLDVLEGVTYGHYRRVKAVIRTGVPFAFMRSWVYLYGQDDTYCHDEFMEIAHGDWIKWAETFAGFKSLGTRLHVDTM